MCALAHAVNGCCEPRSKNRYALEAATFSSPSLTSSRTASASAPRTSRTLAPRTHSWASGTAVTSQRSATSSTSSASTAHTRSQRWPAAAAAASAGANPSQLRHHGTVKPTSTASAERNASAHSVAPRTCCTTAPGASTPAGGAFRRTACAWSL